jgi:hypothetical protein
MSEQPPAEIEERLLALQARIDNASESDLRHEQQAEMPEWEGADVVITSDLEYEPHGFMDHDLRVQTRHAKALTWLFLELRDTFGDRLDASNKYGFYGALAETASAHLAEHQPETDDARPLLHAVLDEALRWARVARDDGLIPPNATLVVHPDGEADRRGD